MSILSSTWIDIQSQQLDTILLHYQSPLTSIYKLQFPNYQDPQLIIFIGDDAKSVSIKRLGLSSSIRPRHHQIHLEFIPGSTISQSPIFLADCELHNSRALQVRDRPTPVDVKQRPLKWHGGIPQGFDVNTLAHIVYTKLLSPFSTVICLFADDLGGLKGVASILASWVVSLSNRASDLPASTYPKVLILKEWNDLESGIFDEKLATRAFMEDVRRESKRENGSLSELDELLAQRFGELRVLAYTSHPSDFHAMTLEDVHSHLQRLDQSWKSLRNRLFQDSQDVQDRRREAQVAFTANHFRAFFDSAYDHFAQDIATPFSYIRASRLPNPIPLDLGFHLISFLKRAPRKLDIAFAAPVIASALSLDSFPPDMHSKQIQRAHITH